MGSVQEDALNAVSVLAEVLGEQFIKYLDAFKPYLLIGLRNHAEYQVCSVAVGLVGDICRAVGGRVLPHCDDIMNILLENLGVRQREVVVTAAVVAVELKVMSD